jgi:hypothetical protein
MAGQTTYNPIDWSHTTYVWNPPSVVPGSVIESTDASYAGAYVFTQDAATGQPRYWPYYTQARSGDEDIAVDLGDYQWKGDTAVGFATTIVTFIPDGNGIPNKPACYPASCGSANSPELKTIPLTAGSAGLCAQ